uniref:HAT C-terminal dimerisation domain-containing protein n=1 Tax=Chenopodium quinoa TaxID=63459 RepID=A0A803LS80_CHEQI
MNVLIYMGTILDPKVKFVGLKLAFGRMYPSPKDEELSQIVYRRATSLFDDYRKMYTPFTSHSDDSFSTSSRCEHELEMDILTWRKINAHRYPILAHLARDVLAMPISTVASESAFSVGGCHLDSFRSSLTPKLRIGFVLGKIKKEVLSKNWNKLSNLRKIDIDDLMVFKIFGAISLSSSSLMFWL